MPRPAVHSVDSVLDAARDLIVEGGPRAAGVRAIAERSGAPSGSLYHRFGSRDELLARAWLRAARRYQAGLAPALARSDAVDAAAAAARWGVEFALANPADARLLLDHSRASLLDAEPSEPLAGALRRVNEPVVAAVRELAERLHGGTGPEALERATHALIDLPYAVLRRHLLAGTLSEGTAATLEAAVRRLVTEESR